MTVFSSQRYLLYSLVVHALVMAAAVMLSSVVESEAVQVHPIEVEEPPPERPKPVEPPQVEVDVEETREDVPLEDIHIIALEPADQSSPVRRRRWTPRANPKEWLTKIVPPPSEEPPEKVEVAKPSTPPPPAPRPAPRPPPVIEVIEGQDPSPVYPGLAQRRGWEGDVLIDVEVDVQGIVLTCAVARSSGFSMLDSAAATAVREWRFRNGPGNTRVRVSFVLGRLPPLR